MPLPALQLVVLAQSGFEEEETWLDTWLETNGPVVGFVLLVGLMLFGLWGIYRALKGHERAQDLARLAQQHGWRYLPESSAAVNTDLPFVSFKVGDGRGTANVLRTTMDGHEVTAFDFWWYVERDDGTYAGDGMGYGMSMGGAPAGEVRIPNRSYYSISCAMTGIDNVLPHLVVTRENLATRAAGAVGVKDIELESEEFNRAFHVRCQDRRFATIFLDAAMQDFMLSAGKKVTFEIRGRWILLSSPLLGAEDMGRLLVAAGELRRRIPRHIDDLFPPIVPGEGS